MKQKHDYGSASHWDTLLQEEFEKESDRAAVILVASIFDNALNTYLRQILLPVSSSSDELFDPANAPLGTFSAKIAMAYRMGLLSHRFCRDLHLIRKVRNEFAHNVHGCTFETSSVRARILELAKSSEIIERNPKKRKGFPNGCRGDFVFIASWMLYALNKKIEVAVSMKECPLEFGYIKDLNEDLLKKPIRKTSKLQKSNEEDSQ